MVSETISVLKELTLDQGKDKKHMRKLHSMMAESKQSKAGVMSVSSCCLFLGCVTFSLAFFRVLVKTKRTDVHKAQASGL